MSVTQQDLLHDLQKPPFWKTLGGFDWLWAVLVMAGSVYAYSRYQSLMDGYETGILFGTGLALTGLGWHWKSIRVLGLAVALLSLTGISLYGSSLTNGESNFFLKFILSGQSAVMWMSALFIAATPVYFAAMLARSGFTGREMLGKTNWVINDLELSISHPRFDSTSFTISGLRTLRDGKVEFNAFPDGGAFALERTDFGFCAGWRS